MHTPRRSPLPDAVLKAPSRRPVSLTDPMAAAAWRAGCARDIPDFESGLMRLHAVCAAQAILCHARTEREGFSNRAEFAFIFH